MPVWQLGMDVTGVVQGTAQVASALGRQNTALQEAIVTMTKYNQASRSWTQTVKGSTTAGDAFTAQFRQSQAGAVTNFKNFGLEEPEPVTGGGSGRSILDRLPQIASVQLLKQAINATIHEISSGTQEAIKFQTAISQIRTVAESSNGTFTEWAGTVRKLSDEFGQTQTDVAQAAIKALTSQVVESRADVEQFVGTASQFGEIVGGTAVQGTEALTSAIKAFGKDAKDAQSVAESLFALYKNSGASVQEIANGFKHAGTEANALGIDFHEFNATLITLTQKGVAFGEASTALNEILSALSKPSKELKEVYAQLGVTSAQVLFQTYGFADGLKKLSEAAGGTVPELAKILGGLHGLKGEVGITLLKGLDENIQKSKDAAASYAEASRTIIESPGKQIQLELNKIKNYFIDDLGTNTLATINNVSKEFGGLGRAVQYITEYLGKGILIWGTYKAAIPLITLADTTTTFLKMGPAIGSVTPYAAAFTASFLLMYNAMKEVDEQSKKISEGLKAINESNKQEHKVQFIDTSDLETYRNEVDTVFKAVDVTLANSFINANNRVNTLRDSTRQIGADLEVEFRSVIDKINEGIRDLTRRISDSQAEIKKSVKSTVDFQKSLEDELRQQQNKYATPQQKIAFNNQYIRQLQDEIRKAYASGDKDEIESARKKFDEIKKLYAENFDTSVEIAKKGGGLIAVNVIGLKNVYADLLATRKQYEAQYQASLKQSITSLEALSTKEQERVKTIEAAVKSFNDLQKKVTEGTFDKTKPDDKQFFDKKGELDLERVRNELLRRASLIVTQAGTAGAELLKISQGIDEKMYAAAKQLQGQLVTLNRDTQTQITNLNEVMIAERIKKEIEAAQKVAAERKAIAIQSAKEFEDAQKQLGEAIFGSGKGTGKATADLSTFQAVLDSVRTDLKSLKGFGSDLAAGGVGAEAFKKAQDAADKFEAALNSVKSTSKDSLKTPQGLEDFKKKVGDANSALKAMIDAIEKLATIQTGKQSNVFNTLITGEGGVKQPLATITNDIQRQLDLLGQLGDKAAAAQEKFAQSSIDVTAIISNATGGLQDALNRTLNAGQTAESALGTNFKNIGDYISQVQRQVEQFNATINGLTLKGVLLTVSATDPNVPSLPTGNPPVAKAAGGYLWGPRGVDNIPAWLSKGEFVMNAAATDMYRPILESMNQSRRPGYYESGGYVTTNVGDININYTSSGKAETDVRKIGSLLRREIRRGNVKL